MKRPTFLRQLFLLVIFVVMVWASGLRAGGPLDLHSPGIPFRWMGDPPTALIHLDAGSLGNLDAGTALANLLAAAENWEAVGSSSLRIQNGGFIGSIQGPEGAGDFAVSNVFDFLGIDNGGVTPIVFDSEDVDQNGNGDIFDALGLGFGVLGIASPEFMNGTRITEGFVLLNGPAVDPDDGEGLSFRGVITHELGHLINLAHSVVNGQAFFFGGSDALTPDGTLMLPGPEDVETMYPFIDPRAGSVGVEMSTPNLDDIAILSTIYPNPAQPLQGFGAIRGLLLEREDEPQTGGQIIVRNQAGDPLQDAVSAISGDFAGDLDLNNPFTGVYSLNRLTPGGQYSLELRDTVAGGFSTPVFVSPDSSIFFSLGPLPGPEEYYSGQAESHDVGDEPTSGPFLIQVAAGETAEADLLLNDFDPPPNDLCENPIPVALDQIPFSDNQLTRGATMAEDEVASECAFLEEGRSVWYSLTNNSGSEVEIFLRTDDSDYDTLLQVFRGTCQAPVSEVCNDDVSFPFDLTSRVNFAAEPGETYLIRVTALDLGGSLALVANDEPPPPPLNDDCTDATGVLSEDLPFTSQMTTLSATTDPDEPITTCIFLDRPPGSVWYSYANTSGQVQELAADTGGSGYDTVLQVYKGTCAEPVAEACNDDSFGLTSRVTFPAQPGETFLFKVTGFFDTGGELVFNLDLFEELENDDCQDAIQLGRSDLPFMDMIDTGEASNQDPEPDTTCGDPGTPEQSNSVFYSFTNDFSLPVEMELSTSGSEYDTVVQVYTGGCQEPVPEVCNDDDFPGLTSRVTFLAQPGESYLIKVSSFGSFGPFPSDQLSFSARALGSVKSEDMELVVASPEVSVSARGSLTYAVAVHNLSLNLLTGVEVKATLPAETTLVTAGNKGVLCDQSSSTFTCQVGSLSAGGEISFPVTVSPQVAGQTSVHGEVDWDQRTLDIPSSTLVRKVDPFLTLPTSFPVQNCQAIPADQQGSGAPFVGAAVVNLADQENHLILEGFDSQGNSAFLLEDAALLPPGGQTAFIVEDLPGLPTTISTLLARSDERGLVGFFMRGNSPIDRGTSHLDFFNPYPDRNDASFRLFDGNGTQIAEAQHSFPAWGSLKVELQ